jgi:hypothetical protein
MISWYRRWPSQRTEDWGTHVLSPIYGINFYKLGKTTIYGISVRQLHIRKNIHNHELFAKFGILFG